MEQMYRDAHAKIRADPAHQKKQPREGIVKKRSVATSRLCVRVCVFQKLELMMCSVFATLDSMNDE